MVGAFQLLQDRILPRGNGIGNPDMTLPGHSIYSCMFRAMQAAIVLLLVPLPGLAEITPEPVEPEPE